MLVIAIDGACRRNGQPNCIASGGVFIEQWEDEALVATKILSNYEVNSTNQRGELLALITALDHVYAAEQETIIVTDSEYIFNAMTKEWFVGWESRGWLTASLDPVKNSDLWKAIKHVYEKCKERDIDLTFIHIKGHCIPFGKVTAKTLLSRDKSGLLLRGEVFRKYDAVAETSRKQILADASELSYRNNGFYLKGRVQKHYVVINVIADAIATQCVEAADALMA